MLSNSTIRSSAPDVSSTEYAVVAASNLCFVGIQNRPESSDVSNFGTDEGVSSRLSLRISSLSFPIPSQHFKRDTPCLQLLLVMHGEVRQTWVLCFHHFDLCPKSACAAGVTRRS